MSKLENLTGNNALPNLSDIYSVKQTEGIKRGLRNFDGTGVLIGVTGIGSVQGYYVEDGERIPMPGKLFYRGIDAIDIVNSHRKNNTFGYEEVAYLLLFGKLPTKEEYDWFRNILAENCQLPEGFTEDVLLRASSGNIMNQVARGIEALYAYDPDPDNTSPENLLSQSLRIIACLPSMVANAYAVKRHRFEGKSLYLHNPKKELSLSENFLRMIRPSKKYTDAEAKLLDTLFMLHAEHGGGNNSTFVCRAVSSSGTDTYSAVAAAVCSLKGPLHGGANAKVTEMLNYIKNDLEDYGNKQELTRYLTDMLDKKVGDKSGKIYGIGHAVYTVSDPRAAALKECAVGLAKETGREKELRLLENIEEIAVRLICERKNLNIPMCANVDLYSGFVYDMLGIPEELYTPLFAASRAAGWCAHRMEEIIGCGRIMRPAYKSSNKKIPYTEMDKR